MQSLLTRYSLESEPFLQLLARPAILLTGSTAVALYLQENGIDPGFTPNRLDILVAMPQAYHRGSFLSFLQNADLGILFRYLLGRGYNSVPEEAGEDGAEESKEAGDDLRAITLTLVRGDQRIRITGLRCSDPVEYLCSQSNLSVDMTWWNATLGHCETAFPEWTLRRAMRRVNTTAASTVGTQVHDWESRGFALEADPSFLQCLDPRIEARVLEGCRAYDVIGLEDVDAADWLEASPWNILIRVQDAFHAFDRRALHRCMQEKSTAIPRYAIVYDTPHHQSVSEECLDYLLFGDWSVYELCPAHTITYGFANDRQKSVYRMVCYTVEQYVMGDVGVVLAPPSYSPVSAPVLAPMMAEVSHLPPLLLLREAYASSSDSDQEEDPAVVAADRRHSVHRWEQQSSPPREH